MKRLFLVFLLSSFLLIATIQPASAWYWDWWHHCDRETTAVPEPGSMMLLGAAVVGGIVTKKIIKKS